MRSIARATLLVAAALGAGVPARADWRPHTVRQLNGHAAEIELPAKDQLLTKSWNRRTDLPYLVYMPEKDRLLLLVSRNFPFEPTVLWSDDHGASWSPPRDIHTDGGVESHYSLSMGLAYLGGGQAVLVDYDDSHLWSSMDYGVTWSERARLPPAPGGKPFWIWDPIFVEKDPATGKVLRLVETGYRQGSEDWDLGESPSQGLIRFSTDEGRTWSASVQVPEWRGFNEIGVTRAKNGNLVADCRSDGPREYWKNLFDHFCGLGISTSKDDGATWSKVAMLYAWGRHQSSTAVLPNGDMVMSYVVRMGYPNTPEGYPQFGVEAVVSHDNGQTWDLDHRYILELWQGNRTGPNNWMSGSYCTSTVVLPDGSLLTAYCTGYHAFAPWQKESHGTWDVGLIAWNLNRGPVNSDHEIADASFDSDLRNKFDPDTELTKRGAASGRNIARPEMGAEVRSSASEENPDFVLYDPYMRKILTLDTVPAWIEISWPKAHRIDQIRIHPGAPEWARRASTDCVPVDYQLQYEQSGQWVDLVPPIRGAKGYNEVAPRDLGFLGSGNEFYSAYSFAPVSVKAVRMVITRTSDTGKRASSGDQVVVPENKRETCLRLIEVFAAK